jgi:hypothetical protein
VVCEHLEEDVEDNVTEEVTEDGESECWMMNSKQLRT